MSPFHVILKQEMKSWLLECYGDDHDQEMIKHLSFDMLKLVVSREYAGGIETFINDVLASQLVSAGGEK